MRTRVIFSALTVCLALIMTGCGSGGAGDGGGYFVSFTAGGTDYVLTRGYTDTDVFDTGANGAKHSSLDVYYITASGESVAAMDQGPYFAFRLEVNTPGTYDTTGTDVSVGFTPDGTTDYYDDSTLDFTLTLDSFGSVGGVITGTFSGVLEEYGTGTPLTISNGYFYVERLADGAIEAPAFFR